MKPLRLCVTSILILMLFLAGELLAQPIPQYQLSIQNRVLIGTTYQFDIYVKRVGTTNFRLGNSQFILTFNTSSFTSPTITRVASSEQIGTGYFFDQLVAGNELQISLGGNGSYENAGDIDPVNGTRISTYQITGVNVPVPFVNLTWINLPNLIRTGISEINSSENYRDITDATGNSHLNSYTITASSGANGNISPSGVATVNSNGSQVYTITPNPGYHVDSLFIDGVSTTPATSYTFLNVVADRSVRATFALNTINVTVNTTPPGLSVTVDGTTYTSPQTLQWLAGTNHTITTNSLQSGTPGTQYQWQNWNDAGSLTHTISPLVDSTFTASFQTQFALTLVAGSGGTVAASPTAVGGWYNSGQVVGITASPATGFQFSSWTGSGTGSYTGTNNPANITINAPITENASFSLIPVHVTVHSNLGSSVSFNVDGVNYSTTQTFTWNYGSNHTIATTTPQSGSTGTQYLWSNWSDGGAISHTVTPISDTTFVVSFTTQYYLTMVASGGGTVLPSNSWYNAGQSVPISATANVGKSFSGWNGSGTGSYSGSSNPASVTMNGPITETASFTTTPTSVTIQSNPPGLAITVDGISYTAPQLFIWDYNSTHTVVVSSPQSGTSGTRYVWNNWSDGGAISHTIIPLHDTTFIANFTTQYLLTLIAGTGGNAGASPTSTDGWYNGGASVQLTATPTTGYSFSSWKGSGVISYTGTNNPTSITVNSPIFDTALFSLNTLTITVTQGSNGTITPGTVTLNYGGSQSFFFTPQTGYHVDSVFIDGVQNVDSLAGYTFNNVIVNHTIRVVFKINQYTITASSGAGGTIAPVGNVSVTYNGSQRFTYSPVIGYHLDSLFVDGIRNLDSLTGYTFNNVVVNHTIRVTFAIDMFTITPIAGANGSISPPTPVTVAYGSTAPFTFSPDPKYIVDSIIVDGIVRPYAVGYTFTNVTSNHTIRVTFTYAPDYLQMFRTFTYNEMTVSKPLLKKPVSDYWQFKITNHSGITITRINIQFKSFVSAIISSPNFIATGPNTYWTFSGALLPNDSVIITGRSVKPVHQIITKLTFDPAVLPPQFNLQPQIEYFEYPMPNLANVRNDAYQRGAFTPTGGLVVGIPRPDMPKLFGWVRILKPANLYKSLIYHGLHTGAPHGFDLFDNDRRFVKEQPYLTPTKQNNVLFADLLTLKFNIAISARSITLPGFGELRYVQSGNPYSNMLIRDIAARADSMMTLWVINPVLYAKLDTTIQQLNASFSGAFDTLSWYDSLKIKGVRALFSVPYLQASGIPPQTISGNAGREGLLPDKFALLQNYPNPFNPTTTISFMLASPGFVTLKVYNILGQEVQTLLNREDMDQGLQEIGFNGNSFASGLYFYRLTVETTDDAGAVHLYNDVRKMLLMK